MTKANVAWVEGCTEEVREAGYQEKHKERLAHSLQKLSGSWTVERESEFEYGASEAKQNKGSPKESCLEKTRWY